MSELVFKICKPSATFHAIGYNEKKAKEGKAKCIYLANFGHLQFTQSLPTKSELVDYLQKYSEGNKRTTHKQFHAIVSCKHHSYTHEQLKEKAIVVVEKLGYKDQPIVMYAHSDTKNNHIHIVTSRIDGKGQKIDDSFEKSRSARILLELLQKEPKNECQRDLSDCLSYRFGTDAQFRLLMEQRGYKVVADKDAFEFVKHGASQGTILKSEVTRQCEKLTNAARIRQVQAIIGKYKNTYDTALKLPEIFIDNRRWQSDLTIFLKERLGLEFVFFTTKEGKPHGYSIIDHAAKAVYKGSEVMRLNELIQPPQIATEIVSEATGKDAKVQTGQLLQDTNLPANAETYLKDTKASGQEFSTEDHHTENRPQENGAGNPLQIIVDESEKNNRQTATSRKPRRKRKDFI